MSDDPKHDHQKRGFFARVRGNFFTGLVFIAPIALTLWFVWWAVNFINDNVEPLIPPRFNPNLQYGWNNPFFGVLVFIVVTTTIGYLTKGLIGRQLMRWTISFMDQFPVIRPLYRAIKQIVETVFSRKENSFQNACLVEYPRKGIYAIGFISTQASGEVAHLAGHELTAVFLPTTPNPTSGFLLYFPSQDIKILDMSVEDAAKLIISAGLVEPEHLPTVMEPAEANDQSDE